MNQYKEPHTAREIEQAEPRAPQEPQYLWWVGSNDEHYHVSFATRAEAVAEAKRDGGAYICEASQVPLKLSDYFDAADFVELANEDSGEYASEDGDPIFDVLAEQEKRLQTAVRAAIDAWQAAEGLVFTPYTFTDIRNREYIEGDAK